MGTFTASLRAIGDVRALPATVELADGRLSIAAGATEIGSWSLAEVHLEEIPTGFRLAAEGDQIIIELKDVDSFAAELENGRTRRLRLSRKKKSEPERAEPARTVPVVPARPRAVAPVDVAEPPSPGVTLPPREKTKVKPTGWAERALHLVDGTLSRASKRFGPYLPEWVFTRMMFAVAFIALVVLLAFPGPVSAFLLIAGALIVVLGAVTYTDTMLASRWLPGRTQPPHVLLFGVAILMMGVLLGVIAR